MDIKKRLPAFLIGAGIFTIAYIIFAAKPLAEEYQFTPEWILNLSSPVDENIFEHTNRIYFKLGQNIGYFTENGKIAHIKPFPSKASISDDFYTLYNSNAKNLEFFDEFGNSKGKIDAFGYPMFDEERIYVFLPGGSSFAKCNSDGSVAWIFEGTIPITAFDSNKNYTAAGFADGTIRVFENKSGSSYIEFSPGGSDLPVILGVSISDDGKYVASVSGHGQQRFVLAQKEEGQPKIIFHDFLKTDTTMQTLVSFSKDCKKVYYNYQNNVGIYDIKKQESTTIPVNGRIISVEEGEDLVFMLSRKSGSQKNSRNFSYTVFIIEKSDTLEGSFSFDAGTAFIRCEGQRLFVGKDNTISSLLITKE